MHEMLQNSVSVCFCVRVCCVAFLGMSLRLRYEKLPELLQRRQVGVRPAASGGGEVFPGAQVTLVQGARAHQVFPGARSVMQA